MPICAGAIPAAPRTTPANRDNYLMEKKYYALSYNDAKGTPNWVSWRLVREDVGDAVRARAFPSCPDNELPPGFKKIVNREYDRQRLRPRPHVSGRRPQQRHGALKATFVMTNIVPQSPPTTARAWEQLETYCRNLAKQGKELYIVAGPNGQGGEGTKGRAVRHRRRPGRRSGDDLEGRACLESRGGVDADARLIAVNVPNTEKVGEDWSPFRVSVNAVENLTGYHFFDRADPSVLGPLKDKVDRSPVPRPREHNR